MSRSNGPNGPQVPPAAWPTSRPQTAGQPSAAPGQQGSATPPVPQGAYDPYQDPYYSQAPQHRQAAPQPAAPQQQPARAPRIQSASPPTRAPQHGLPTGQPGAQHGYAQPPQGQQGQASGQPQAGYPQQQNYTPQQPPFAGYPGEPLQSDPRYGAQANYQQPIAPRGAAPAGYPQAQPHQAPPLQQYGGPQLGGPPPAYVPETTARAPQPPQLQQQQRQPSAYEQWAAQGQPQSDLDPQGYDLGTYMPSPAPRPFDSQRQGDQTTTGQRTAQPMTRPAPADQYAQYAPAPGPQFADPSSVAATQHGQELEPVDSESEYEEHYEDEEPPRARRYGLIAASLIGAIALGGGLAYAYKAFVMPPTQVAGTPVVKGGNTPVKVKPVDPGGTKFANADSKLMDSLSGTPTEPATSSTPSDGGPRAVQTMRINPDGSIANAGPSNAAPPTASAPPTPPTSTPQATAASIPTSQPVPGMTLVLPPPRVAAPAASPPQMAQAAAIPKSVTPKIVAAAPTVLAAAGPANDAGEPIGIPPPAKKLLAPAKKIPAAGLGAGGAAAVSGANGFVAVLASVPASGTSRTQAMQQFADLQQKYNGVLAGKAPDVVEAKLEKGSYHRLIVGPPASRESATALCTQLKAAGYTSDCWVTGF
jgi:hypothetical protein